MHGLFRAAGSPAVVRLSCGLRLVPVTLRVLGQAELFLSSQSRHPAASLERLREAGIEIPSGIPIRSLRESYEVTTEELIAFLKSPEGCAFVVWCAVRDELEYEEVLADLSSSDALERVTIQLSEAGGYDLLVECDFRNNGESTGQASPTGSHWRLLLHDFAEVGIDPSRYGDMTLYQFRAVATDRKRLTGGATISAAAIRAMTPDQRAELLEEIKRGPSVT